MKKSDPKIVVIGGGTGSFTILSTLKNFTSHITALVNMVDDGGSTGVLRDELGVLPPGDVRQCLVALSNSSTQLRELFNYRFPEGTFGGHSFGNLFLSAVEKMTDDFGEAVATAGRVLSITGEVLPITLDDCQLVFETTDETITGQYTIESKDIDLRQTGSRLYLKPHAIINPAAKVAIKNADLIVIAPGNLYSSLIPPLMVDGIAQALHDTKAPLAYVCNLVNKPTQTKSYGVHDYVNELERYVGKGTIDFVLYNTDLPDEAVLKAYALDGEYPVEVDEQELKNLSATAISGHFLSRAHKSRNQNDTFILRSLIRHDAEAVCKALLELAHDPKAP